MNVTASNYNSVISQIGVENLHPTLRKAHNWYLLDKSSVSKDLVEDCTAMYFERLGEYAAIKAGDYHGQDKAKKLKMAQAKLRLQKQKLELLALQYKLK